MTMFPHRGYTNASSARDIGLRIEACRRRLRDARARRAAACEAGEPAALHDGLTDDGGLAPTASADNDHSASAVVAEYEEASV